MITDWPSVCPTTVPCVPSGMSAKCAALRATGSASNGTILRAANTMARTRARDTLPVRYVHVHAYYENKRLKLHPGLSKSPTAASFVRPTRPAEKPRTFLQALQDKYAGEVTADQQPISLGPQVVISGKVAEEIGFDKIRKQQAELSELKVVIVDGMRIDSASAAGAQEKPIRAVCPKVTELVLSRNLFVSLGPAVEICSHLQELRGLRLK